MGVMEFGLSDIGQVISELEGWEKKYLPDNPQAGKIKLLDIVGDRPLKSVVSWSEWNHHQPEADKVKAEYTKIVQWFQKGNAVVSKDLDDNPFVADEKGFRLQLTDLLRNIEGNIKADFATERPIETRRKVKITKTLKKTEKRFQPWRKSGDACFVIENNRIKFHYKKEVKDLRLRNETNPHKLLFLFAAKNPLPQVEIKKMCKKKTRPSDIAKQTNTKLSEKIAAMALPGVPKNIEFVKYDDKSKCYGLWPEIKHKDDVDYE